jgi:hypothetical protein
MVFMQSFALGRSASRSLIAGLRACSNGCELILGAPLADDLIFVKNVRPFYPADRVAILGGVAMRLWDSPGSKELPRQGAEN